MVDLSRREFLKRIALSAVPLTMLSCSDNPPSNDKIPLEVIVGRNVQALSDDPADYLPVNWAMIPGGTQESLSPSQSYYMKLTVNRSVKPDASLLTLIQSGDLLLMMMSSKEGDSKMGEVYHLETDGYTMYLNAADSQKRGIDVYFSLSDKDDVEYHAKLPPLSQLTNRAVKLNLDVRPQDKLGSYTSIDKSFFHPGAIPAIARLQGNEKTIYILHKKQQ